MSKLAFYKREWQRKNADKHNARMRLWNMNNIEKFLYRTARDRAKKRGIEFSISVNDIVIPEVCPVFKTKFVYCSPYAATLDRIDPRVGYVKGNIQVLSKRANAMKSDATPEQLLRFAEYVQNSFGDPRHPCPS